MGTDIYMHVETQRDGEWSVYAMDVYGRRSYVLFAVLADVRNSFGVRPITAPRGLPEDCSDAVRRDLDDLSFSGHSLSWLTIEEIINYRPWCCFYDGNTLAWHCRDFWTTLMPELLRIDAPVRIVFGFDY